MGDILVGTASWADKSLLDSRLFYPKEAKTAEARLRYYSTHFPLVEVDSSYYALPVPQAAELWAQRTPESFVFDVKAFRIFTQHQTPPNVLPADIREALGPLAEKKNVYYADFPPELMDEMWRRFRLALEPLRHAGKLGAVLFQFPPWFFYRRSNLEHIARCAQVLDGYQIAVEFRNKTWFEEKHLGAVLAFERELSLVHVIVDEPQGFSSSIPAVWEVTCPALAIFRLHGRNAQTWEKKGLATSSERFDYEYQEEELQEFVAPVGRLARQARRVHVLFNNNLRDQGIRGARLFSALLGTTSVPG
ncbi:MAG TPA: DUF72 domain-containing protein [Burkholderiales bacterium]|nr:DUF72 domain-containing protein [Burkholderiales bacterium]